MRYFYYTIRICEHQKYYSYVLRVCENNNLLYILKDIKNAVIVHPCKTKRDAEAVAFFLNDNHRENGRLLEG